MNHFIIIGAPKCGTTSLYQYLSRHTEISLSEQKESNYFRSALFDWRDERTIRNRMRHVFLELFARNGLLRAVVRWRYFKVCGRKRGLVSGDGSVSYFHERGMAKRIHQYLPSAKLILMLRNPVDRIYSNFWMNVRQGVPEHQRETFEEFVDKGRWYSRVSLYAENLREWLKYFPMDQIYIIDSRALDKNRNQVLMGLFEFLGVQQEDVGGPIRETPYAERANEYPPMENPTRERLTKLLSYQRYHLAELAGVDFEWFSD